MNLPLRHFGETRAFAPSVAWFVALLAVGACTTSKPVEKESTSAAAALEPVASRGAWSWIQTEARQDHASVLLGDRRALLCGGTVIGTAPPVTLQTCEVFALNATGSLERSTFPMLPEGRQAITLTLLDPNRVLVVGGVDSRGTVFGARVGTLAGWGAPELGFTERAGHTASLLGDTVLVIGGETVAAIEARSTDGIWTSVGSAPRIGHTATELSSTEVLLVGGFVDNRASKSAGIFSLVTGYRPVDDLPESRYGHTATLLPDGSVLVVGGANDTERTLGRALRFQNGRWDLVDGAEPRIAHAAARMGDYVIVAGGERTDSSGEISTLDSVQAFDGTNWFALAPMYQARSRFQLIALDDRHLLASGGSGKNETLGSVEVFAPAVLGEACAADDECILGHCVDDVCCNRECDGMCESCAEPGRVGACSGVSGKPRPEHGQCDPGYLCQNGACATSCSSDDVCSSGHFCADGECTPKRDRGGACETDSACADGRPCVDGVCCQTACAGQCESCNADETSSGFCTAIMGEPRGDRPLCGDAEDAACAATCDGKERRRCVYPTTPCGDAVCDVERFQAQPVCDGAGRCVIPEVRDCAPAVCNADGCLERCSTDDQCAPGAHCEGTVCRVCDERTCLGFSCDLVTDACKTMCERSDTDCQGGYYCHPFRHTCVELVAFPEAQLPACATRVPTRSSTGLVSALFFWALTSIRRSQRRGQSGARK